MKRTSKDLRVRRTIKSIRAAFFSLVMEKAYEDISITELTERAEINRKTFYLHYNSLGDLIKEIEDEIVADILEHVKDDAQNLDVAGCIDKFYRYLDNCGEVYQKLLCDPHYTFFYEDVTDAVLKSAAFQRFFDRTQHPQIVRSYSIAITFMYRNWKKNAASVPLDELIAYASRLILDGYSGVTQA